MNPVVRYVVLKYLESHQDDLVELLAEAIKAATKALKEQNETSPVTAGTVDLSDLRKR